MIGWTTCTTLPFCFSPISVMSCLCGKDTRLSLRYIFIFAFRERLRMKLVVPSLFFFAILNHWVYRLATKPFQPSFHLWCRHSHEKRYCYPCSQASRLRPECEYVYAGRAWYLFSYEHDIIKIGPEFFRTERQHFVCYSTNFMFNAWCARVWYSPPDS